MQHTRSEYIRPQRANMKKELGMSYHWLSESPFIHACFPYFMSLFEPVSVHMYKSRMYGSKTTVVPANNHWCKQKSFHYIPYAQYVCTLHHPPFCYISGGLEEAGVVVLLQALFGLGDEGAGALQTLATVCNLLSQLTQFHHLEHTHIPYMLLCCDTLMYIYSLRNENTGNNWVLNETTTFFYYMGSLSHTPAQTRVVLWCYWTFMLISCGWKWLFICSWWLPFPPLHKFGKKVPRSSLCLKNASQIWSSDFSMRYSSLRQSLIHKYVQHCQKI